MNRWRIAYLAAACFAGTAYCKPTPSLATADAFYAAGKFSEAADAYRALLARSPSASAELQMLFKLGVALKGLRQYSDAITNFQRKILGETVYPGVTRGASLFPRFTWGYCHSVPLGIPKGLGVYAPGT